MSRRKRRQAKSQSNHRIFQFAIIAVIVIGVIAGITFLQSDTSQAEIVPNSQVSQVSQQSESVAKDPNPYEGILGPEDWTDETPVKIYNRLYRKWQDKSYGDVGSDMEFIVEDYVYGTTPKQGFIFLKPEIDIAKLAETDQSFDPDNWRIPKPDDIVFLYKSGSRQGKGHWLLKDVQPDSKVVFQGKVWAWELDASRQNVMVRDTGNVFAEVIATHKEVHEGDVLALTVHYESCGKQGLITGSEEHPFYVLDVEDYIPMVDLEPGMELKTDNGTQATVIELKPLPEAMELYNLTVKDVHNYYIFSSEDEPGVLVHNVGFCDDFLTPGGHLLTEHSRQRAIKRGFGGDTIDNIINGFDDYFIQDDGREIFTKLVGHEKFDVIITEGDEIVTVIENMKSREIRGKLDAGVWY